MQSRLKDWGSCIRFHFFHMKCFLVLEEMFCIIQTFHQTLFFCHPHNFYRVHFSSVAQLCPTLRPPGLQDARHPCPSPTPGAYSNSGPSIWCCPPTMSSSVIPFSPCLQSFPASRTFPRSQFFISGGQSIGSFSFSINPSNECSGLISFRIDWFDLLAVQGTLKNFLQHHSSKASILQCSAFFIVQLSLHTWLLEKP